MGPQWAQDHAEATGLSQLPSDDELTFNSRITVIASRATRDKLDSFSTG